MVKQLSIFLENRAGRLRTITSLLSSFKINIRALSLADASDFGVLRLIVDQPERAEDALRNNNYTINTADVLAVEMEDVPGALDNVLEILAQDHINIEYMYTFNGCQGDKAIIIFKVDKPILATNILSDNEIAVLTSKNLTGRE
jgi:hypothetical protein